MKRKMVALKPFRYATRALRAGDPFDASRMDARTLEAIGKARIYVEPPKPAPKPKAEDDLDALREEAEKAGVDVDGRWGEARLKAEIAKAKDE